MDLVLNRTRSIMLKTSLEQLWNNKMIKKREMSMGWRMLHRRMRHVQAKKHFMKQGESGSTPSEGIVWTIL